LAEGGGGRALSAAAGRAPPGLPAPAGAAGAGGHAGVTLASADSEIQDFSLGSDRLQPGLDPRAAGAVVLAPPEPCEGVQTSDLFLNTSDLSEFLSGSDASSIPSSCLHSPEEDIMAGELMDARRPLQKTAEEKEPLSLKSYFIYTVKLFSI